MISAHTGIQTHTVHDVTAIKSLLARGRDDVTHTSSPSKHLSPSLSVLFSIQLFFFWPIVSLSPSQFVLIFRSSPPLSHYSVLILPSFLTFHLSHTHPSWPILISPFVSTSVPSVFPPCRLFAFILSIICLPLHLTRWCTIPPLSIRPSIPSHLFHPVLLYHFFVYPQSLSPLT